MLVDKIYNAEKIIEEYESAQNKLNESKRLSNIEKQVKKANKELEDLMEIKLALDSMSIGHTNFLPGLYETIEKIEVSFEEGYEYVGATISDLTSRIESHNSDLKFQWKRYFESNYSNILGTLKLLQNLFDDKDMIRLRGLIVIIGQRWPISIKDINELESLNKKAEKLIGRLDLSDDIQRFLNLTLRGEATVEHLDKNTLQWLRETGAEGNIVLSFKGR